VKLPQYAGFRGERERFALRFTCEHCALFDPDHNRCAHGFPTDEHRLAYYDRSDAEIVFCKDFELA
jgi:hypothetical protein